MNRCFYLEGQYTSKDDFKRVDAAVSQHESGKKGDRIFYLAIPPSLFVDVATAVHAASMARVRMEMGMMEMLKFFFGDFLDGLDACCC